MAKKEVDSYLLRIPKPLREKLEQATRESGKTLRAEILERLEASFGGDQRPDTTDPALAARVAELEQRLEALERLIADKRR